MAEISRPKVLVFLCLWCLLSGIEGEASELSGVFEACGGTGCKGDMLAMAAAGSPSMTGAPARVTEFEAFLQVLKPAASPLRTPGHAAG